MKKTQAGKRKKNVESKFFSSNKQQKTLIPRTQSDSKTSRNKVSVTAFKIEASNQLYKTSCDVSASKKLCTDLSELSNKSSRSSVEEPCCSKAVGKLKQFEWGPTVSVETSQTDSVLDEEKPTKQLIATAGSKKTDHSFQKYTPLELQFLDIKSQYPDAVLFVECGYKYRFFGEDAEIASKVLRIMCNPDHNMMTASIPVHRLPIHVHRLVSAGYKVGVVKQTETHYLKAAGDNRCAPFSRKLSSLYTKSTLIGPDVTSLNETGSNCSVLPNQYLMCINETPSKQKERHIGLVSIDPSTGDIVYDEFIDGALYKELETRISHLHPVEILLSSDASEEIRSFMMKVAEVSSTADDRIRIEFISQEKLPASKTFDVISEFYSEDQSCLRYVLNFSKPLVTCLATLCVYLKDFHLDQILRVTSNFHQFSQCSHYMLLNSMSIKNLELLHNSWDGSEKGSLFWLLNQTSSPFGARLLRKWILQPLLDVGMIQERLNAVEEIAGGSSQMFNSMKEILKKMPDVEKGICSIYHQKCSPMEFFSLAQALEKVRLTTFHLVNFVSSSLLHSLLTSIHVNLDGVESYCKNLNQKAIRENDVSNLFLNTEPYPLIHVCKKKIADICQLLSNHLIDIRKKLKRPSLQYTTVFKVEFLIEVKLSHIKHVPADWIYMSSTNSVARFHTPLIADSYCKLKELREDLRIQAESLWHHILQEFSSHYIRYKQAATHLATLDCLIALATVASQNSFCKPKLDDGPSHIEIIEGRHPVIDTLKQGQDQYVPNSTRLHTSMHRVQVISGPNMGGKSSYLRQVALIAIMAQIGSYVPATSVSIGVLDAIFISMGSWDELFKGQSTFMVELLGVSEILEQVTERSLVILDELGRGTSTHDGVAIAYATLEHFITNHRCLVIFVTHYPMLLKLCQLYPESVVNSYMAVQFNEDNTAHTLCSDEDGAITFLYQLNEGCAVKSYGLNVAQLANLPNCILNSASHKSLQLEKQMLCKEYFLKLFQAESNDIHSCLKTLADKQL